MITERLKSALTKEDEVSREQQELLAEPPKPDDSIVTTEEELEGFLIVKTILRQKVAATRIVHRDAQSYFAILLDDNNRKTLCRLYLGGIKKYLVVLDSQRKEIRHEISSLDDIFKHSDALLAALAVYETKKVES